MSNEEGVSKVKPCDFLELSDNTGKSHYCDKIKLIILESTTRYKHSAATLCEVSTCGSTISPVTWHCDAGEIFKNSTPISCSRQMNRVILICRTTFPCTDFSVFTFLRGLNKWGSAVNWCLCSALLSDVCFCPTWMYGVMCWCNCHYCHTLGFCDFTSVFQHTVKLSSTQMTLAEMCWRCMYGPSVWLPWQLHLSTNTITNRYLNSHKESRMRCDYKNMLSKNAQFYFTQWQVAHTMCSS